MRTKAKPRYHNPAENCKKLKMRGRANADAENAKHLFLKFKENQPEKKVGIKGKGDLRSSTEL